MKNIDIDVVYNQLVEKLKGSDYSGKIPGIENSLAGAATASEALMDQGFYLINLRHSNLPAFKLVEEEINSYLEYCRQRGLIIRQS
jgi:hypothetical protein